jgi:serine/threonine-protein kinase
MPPPDPYIGKEILDGQFKILQRIGTGGMGSVYKASQPEMNRMVAVKILHTKLTDRKDLASRFRREARALSHLTHPNTVKVMMYGELDNGALYIVMEYLEGKNLHQLIKREGPLPVERAIPVLVQTCGALQEAHELGIVHRDIKPENIFLTRSGGMDDFVKVLDFGLAKVTERELRPGSVMLTQEGMVFGTPEFMSPEQAQGVPLDARSDIYSLAVILYEALTGKLPFDGKTPMEYIQLHVTAAPIELDRRVPGRSFAPGLGEVLRKALAKSPEERYPSARDFGEALRPFAAGGTGGQEAPFPAAPVSASAGSGSTAWTPVDSPTAATQADSEKPTWIAPAPGQSAPLAMSPAPTTPAPVPAPAFQPGRPTVRRIATTAPSTRTLLLVASLSIIAGVVLTILALKLLG